MSAEPLPVPERACGTWPKAVPLLVLAGLLAYANSFNKAFVFDDIIWIPGNPHIGNFRQYMEEWTRPVVRLSIQFNYRLGGVNPAGYHALNLAVHVLAGLSLYGLIRRALLLPRFAGRYDTAAPYLAFSVALLWLIHPLQTQSVTYIIQRCESMMGLFYLFALYAWLRGATGGARGWYLLAIGSFALCCGCKEVSATLPPVLVLFDRIFLAHSWRAVARRWVPYAGLFAVWVLSLVPLFLAAFGGATDVGIGFGIKNSTPWTYLLTQSEVILHYVRLSVWPVRQSIDYFDWPIAKSLREVWPAFVVVSAALGASLALLYYRPPAGFVCFCFFAFLAPTSSIMPIADPAFEHRMYLSLAPVLIGLVFAGFATLEAANWSDRKRAAFGLSTVAAATVMLLPLTYARNETYRTQIASLEHTAAVRPNNPRTWVSLAAMYMNAGQLDKADAAVRQANALPNNFGMPIRQRAPLLAVSGRLDESAEAYRTILADGWYHFAGGPAIYKNYTWVQLALGRSADAVATMRRLVSHQPEVGDNRLTLAAALLAAGQTAEAEQEAREAVRLDPGAAARSAAEARLFVLAPAPPAVPLLKPRALWQAAAACLADGDRDPMMLDTLAMAYAWNGKYPDAADAARRGIAAAEAAGAADWAQALRARLKLYEAGKPYGK